MSYPYEFAITFHNRLSLTLNAILYDSTGVQVGATITSGFVDYGNGAYSYLASLPDGHVGTFLIFDSAEPNRCFLWAINPREMENADVKTSLVKAKTDNLPSDPADASDIATSFSAVTATLTTIAGYIDTEVAAIKAKTDNLPSSPAAVSDIPTPTQINTALTTAHGAGPWTTATGFATLTDVTNAQTAITAAIAALNNLSQAQAQTAATAALNAYDGPTKAELDAAQAAIQADIAGIEGGGGGGSSAADIWTYPDRTLTRFGNMTGIEFTYTVTNSVSGLPISGVAVWFAVDGGGAQIVWSGHTDALGVARDAYGALPRLDPGTYYVFRSRPGYVFRNPDTEIINE